MNKSSTSNRKSDHIRINLDEDVSSGLTTGLEKFRFVHNALPEINLNQVNMSQTLFNKVLKAPIMISSMTGGTPEAEKINRILATAAQESGIAMGLGSQRSAIDHPEHSKSFQVRSEAPDTLLFANLGAIQLNYGYGIPECQKAVDMIEADALILHLNPLQEAVQPEGDTNFAGLLQKIEDVCKHISVPVIAKEVGWGISKETARQLADVGVSVIDVAGAGGTSWSQVEMHRAQNSMQKQLAASFIEWGIPTADAIINVKQTAPEIVLFASGGIRNGVEIAKCIALGATLGGIASPFLKAANHSVEKVIQLIKEIQNEIQVTMFATGSESLEQLQNNKLLKT
jgi:isopentenyl-diphosphate delta-isomerase